MLLRSCSAHEAYIRSYRGRVRASHAIEFLLLDSIFPRSAAHCLLEIDEALETLAKLHGSSFDRMGTAARAVKLLSVFKTDSLQPNLGIPPKKLYGPCRIRTCQPNGYEPLALTN